MSNELMIQDARPLTVAEVKANINLIQQVMKGVMKENTHFGKIPGCGDKPTLLKPGAEKIMSTFRLSVDPIVEDLSLNSIIRYSVRAVIKDAGGRFLGTGVGECSSEEEKYQWRKSVCDGEFDSTPEDQRREKWIKGWNKPDYKVKQIKTNPADVANTVLKMAKKRALIDGVLTVTGASDIFAQDLEDLPVEVLASMHQEEEKPQMPQAVKPAEQSKQAESVEPEKDIDAKLRLEITSMLKKMHNEDTQAMGDTLEKLTEFKGNKGMVKGLRTTIALKGKRLQIAADKIRKDFEIWEQADSIMNDREPGQEG